jgi:protein-disulfide isomerase
MGTEKEHRQVMDKRFLSILAVIVLVFVGIFAFSQNSSNSSSGGNTSGGAKPTTNIKGDGAKNVTLVEYGDFQCPVCELYEPTVEQVFAKYSKDIKLQFRNLPLPIHNNAFAAARAAEAASLQGKFWQMHDTLYQSTNWQVWTRSTNAVNEFNSYAQQLGLNLNQFKKDYTSTKVNDTVNADLSAFNKTGQQVGTPTFFLDGKYIDNSLLTDSNGPSLARFSAIIDTEIAQKSK